MNSCSSLARLHLNNKRITSLDCLVCFLPCNSWINCLAVHVDLLSYLGLSGGNNVKSMLSGLIDHRPNDILLLLFRYWLRHHVLIRLHDWLDNLLHGLNNLLHDRLSSLHTWWHLLHDWLGSLHNWLSHLLHDWLSSLHYWLSSLHYWLGHLLHDWLRYSNSVVSHS